MEGLLRPAHRKALLDSAGQEPAPPECLWPLGLSYYPDQVLPCPVFDVPVLFWVTRLLASHGDQV